MKKLVTFFASAALSLTMGFTAFAGQWVQDSNGWWFQNDNGTWPVGWEWIDGNSDGIAERYYFNESGYCLMNTTTPDGSLVDATGAWIVDGLVQTKSLQETPAPAPAETKSMHGVAGVSSEPYEGYTIVANVNTKKYHVPTCSKVKDIYDKNKGYANDENLLISQGFVGCKICH